MSKGVVLRPDFARQVNRVVNCYEGQVQQGPSQVVQRPVEIFLAKLNDSITQNSEDLDRSVEATLYIYDAYNSTESDSKIKESETVVKVYVALLNGGSTIPKDARVLVEYIPSLNRYEVLNANC